MYAHNDRRGFTLLELLIAMAIMIFLVALAVGFLYSTNFQSENATRGASQLQGWLLIAKQRALRDQGPRGVRLLTQPGSNYVTSLQYIEQPDDYTVGTVEVPQTKQPPPFPPIPPAVLLGITANGQPNPYSASDSNGILVNFYGADVTGGSANRTDYGDWQLQPGDYFESPVPSKALLHLIVAVVPFEMVPQPLQAQGVTSQAYLRSYGQAFNFPLAPRSRYRIIRAPRPQAGEATLELPRDVAIDISGSGFAAGGTPWFSVPPFGPPVAMARSVIQADALGHFDILFSASGSLLGQAQRTGKTLLWVRDIHFDGMQGNQTILCVYNQTGFIAGHPADPGPNNDHTNYPQPATPFTYTQDGRSSGL